MVGPVRPQFVLFGSSIVELSYSCEGWGATLANLYARKADVILRGYCGWNTRRALQALDKIFPKDATDQPSLVIVYFGGNDSMHPHPTAQSPHVPLQEYIENMRKIAIHLMVNFLHNNTSFLSFSTHQSLSKKTRLIFLSSPPINEVQMHEMLSDLLGPLKRTNESCRLYSEACLELCREMNVKAIDLWSALQQRHDWLDVCFTDGIHLSHEGNKIVAKEIFKVLREADWEPSLHWNSMPTEFAEDFLHDPNCADRKSIINVSNGNFQGNSQLE
ncbi:GDSL esterase/lipase CPRD49-like isoform X1 [Vigna umbellata]|uniref:GDSL esterase/lipase CPRD49-like isoform X1 n=1 Tax=Vigna umbellata TaxID=87088 RepID=UPI001F5F1CE8|nr:GDSL esterase/lipase CPRD49-like isoform X1 [Vigna umbellata]